MQSTQPPQQLPPTESRPTTVQRGWLHSHVASPSHSSLRFCALIGATLGAGHLQILDGREVTLILALLALPTDLAASVFAARFKGHVK